MSDTVELAAVIGEYLSWLGVFVDGFVEQPYHVFCCSFLEYVGSGYESAVVVDDRDEPSVVYMLEVALP